MRVPDVSLAEPAKGSLGRGRIDSSVHLPPASHQGLLGSLVGAVGLASCLSSPGVVVGEKGPQIGIRPRPPVRFRQDSTTPAHSIMDGGT